MKKIINWLRSIFQPSKKTYSLKDLFIEQAVKSGHKHGTTVRILEQKVGDSEYRLWVKLYSPDGRRALGSMYLDLKDVRREDPKPLEDYISTYMNMLDDQIEMIVKNGKRR